MKVFPSQNLALSTKITTKAMGNGQYTFWMDGSATGVPAAINKTGNTYFTAAGSETTLQACLESCTNRNLCIGAKFGAYNLGTDGIAGSSCQLIIAKVQVGGRK
jgi:hypothetical protein